MERYINFFAYGANRSPKMISAIIGRVPVGIPSTVRGFELCIQSWSDLPSRAKDELCGAWDSNFSSYCLRPNYKYTSKVKGIVWKITPQERHTIDNWELTGDWYHVFTMTNKDETLEIQVIKEDQKVSKVVNGMRYKTFLNSPRKMREVATKVRLNRLHSK